ncbi:lytic murein transglycosylase [Actinomycetospora straminea]|uniref:Transglycosylase SLT domain-containing protein n=1 Tax=Actinomycetospora straminea TaxID=663607 RepID=A0ABP9EBD5_9PSEU|nr:lytic murein transglycosylase [Actinomycetospora straminea]MDD7932130.1 lytic murein transglycosylase [Actinomycetospora straminea]
MSTPPTSDRGDRPDARQLENLLVAAVVLVLLVGAAVAGVVAVTRRGPDAAPTYAQPAAAPAPADAATRATWAADTAGRSGVPARALAAYAGAEAAARDELADCGLSWVTLAGLGRVESNHGRFGDTALDDGGRPREAIRGPELDGTNGNRTIRDTDGGRLDGDTTYDRAVGPLQFIPTTWALYAADGDGDGVSDPDDLDDAALAAARYLCTDDRDLRRGDDWRAAVLAYNRSQAYVDRVRREALGAASATS